MSVSVGCCAVVVSLSLSVMSVARLRVTVLLRCVLCVDRSTCWYAVRQLMWKGTDFSVVCWLFGSGSL